MLRFVDATPVGRWTGKALAAASATGSAELKLALNIPLSRPSESTVKGTVALAGNDIRMTPDTPLLAAAKGRVDFSQRGFTVSAASARTLGGEIAFEGGSSAGLNGGDSQRFSGRGTVTAEALRQAPELGTLARMAQSLSGQTSYRATLAFVAGRPQISVASNLVGLAIELPAPLAKAAATPLALRVRTAPEDGTTVPVDSAAPLREALQVDLGGTLQAHFVREVSGDAARVVRGAIRVGEPRAVSDRAIEPTPLDPIEALPLPAAGVAANVNLKRLDVEAWQAALARVQGDGARAVAGATASPLVFDAAGGAGYVPDAIALRVGELVFGSRRLGNVTAGLSQQAELWRANVSADELEGYLEYRPARRGAVGAGRVFARLARLSLPKGEVERVESLLDAQPATIPALDVVVDDFELRGKRLGRLEIEATNRGAGNRDGTREWQLAKLNLTMPEAQLAATGTWGDAGATGAGGAARGDELHARARRQRRPARAARHGPRRARRQGLAHRRGRLAGLAVLARLREDDRPGEGGDRLGPVPEGRARARRACSACSACSRCRAACCSIFATCSPRASRSTTSSATSRSARAWRRPTTCACAARPRRC